MKRAQPVLMDPSNHRRPFRPHLLEAPTIFFFFFFLIIAFIILSLYVLVTRFAKCNSTWKLIRLEMSGLISLNSLIRLKCLSWSLNSSYISSVKADDDYQQPAMVNKDAACNGQKVTSDDENDEHCR